MANDYNERRRRAGVRLTPEQEDWMVRAMANQAAGKPLPPLPTETVDGMQRLTPAYTDPRSQAIANSPLRPIASTLDRVFNPGRADAANQMNREYRENALSGQIGRQGQRIEQDYNKARTTSMATSNKMEELKRRALVDGDPEALKLLKAYTAATSRPTAGNDIQAWMNQAKGGSIKDSAGGFAKPNAANGENAAPVITGIRGDRTPADNRAGLETQIAAAKEKFAKLEKIELEGGAIDDNWEMMGTGNVENFPRFRKFTEDELVAASAEKTATEKEIQNLEHTVKTYRPLTSPVTGGPVTGSPTSAAEQTIR